MLLMRYRETGSQYGPVQFTHDNNDNNNSNNSNNNNNSSNNNNNNNNSNNNNNTYNSCYICQHLKYTGKISMWPLRRDDRHTQRYGTKQVWHIIQLRHTAISALRKGPHLEAVVHENKRYVSMFADLSAGATLARYPLQAGECVSGICMWQRPPRPAARKPSARATPLFTPPGESTFASIS